MNKTHDLIRECFQIIHTLRDLVHNSPNFRSPEYMGIWQATIDILPKFEAINDLLNKQEANISNDWIDAKKELPIRGARNC